MSRQVVEQPARADSGLALQGSDRSSRLPRFFFRPTVPFAQASVAKQTERMRAAGASRELAGRENSANFDAAFASSARRQCLFSASLFLPLQLLHELFVLSSAQARSCATQRRANWRNRRTC
jgi:hypothetical protein